MKKFLLAFAMLCGIATVNAQELVFDDNLYVTVDGNTTGPYAAQVKVSMNVDGTINFALDNFVLNDNGDEMPVGNIFVPNLAIAPVDGFVNTYTFSFEGPITIQEGSDPNYEFWAGPALGDIPLTLSGALNYEHMFVLIDIELMGQTIHVEFGKEENVTAINTVKANQKKYVGAFDLAGRKVSDNFKGIRIVNGKKVVR